MMLDNCWYLCTYIYILCLYVYIYIHTVYIMIYLVVTVLKNLLVTWDHRGPNHFRDFQQIQRSACSGGCPVRCSNWFSPGNRHCKFQELRDLRHLQSLLRSFMISNSFWYGGMICKSTSCRNSRAASRAPSRACKDKVLLCQDTFYQDTVRSVQRTP